MRCGISVLATVFASLLFGTVAAKAQCTVPNQLTNGQAADASEVMENFDAVAGCADSPGPRPSAKISSPGSGVVTMQNPSAPSDYNFNLPATAGNAGDLLASGGGGSNPATWTATGTAGHTLPFLDGNNAWSGTQTFGPVIGSVSTKTETSYTLAATDCGTTIVFTSNSPVTLTTSRSLPQGCALAIEQAGTAQVTVNAGTGASQHSAHNFNKTFGRYAILGLFVDSNVGGTAAHFVITGDGTF